jgi:acyl dehydratase
MAVDTSVIGQCTGKWKIVIERGPVATFAKAVKDNSPIYQDANAAKEAGFDAIPAPPTFPFAMNNWGAFDEMQPADNPAVPGGTSPVMKIMGGLMSKGGMILHGEQEFTYHRPLAVGDVLIGEGKVVDLYEKESKGKTMTFLVTENEYRDEQTGEPVVTARMNLIHRA